MVNAVQLVQLNLERLYDVECEERADDFLVNAEQALALGGTGRAPEELLVHEDDEQMSVALFLAPELLSSQHSDLAATLEQMGLEGFCTLTEGVSHFLYLSRAFQLNRHVSLLELEAQAEVDKFAVCVLLHWATHNWARDMLRRLFDDVSYRPELSAQERWRYEEANRLSRNFCRGLVQHAEARRLDSFLSDLRYAFRLGAEAKLRHLSRRHERVAAR